MGNKMFIDPKCVLKKGSCVVYVQLLEEQPHLQVNRLTPPN